MIKKSMPIITMFFIGCTLDTPVCVTAAGVELAPVPAGVAGWSCDELQAAESAALGEFQSSADPRLHTAEALSGYRVTVHDAVVIDVDAFGETRCDGSIDVISAPAGSGPLAHEIAHVLQGCKGRGDGSAHGNWGTPGAPEKGGDVYPALTRLGTAWDHR